MKPRKDSLAATTLSKFAYCEQQVILDKKYGSKRSRFVTQRAQQGNKMHLNAHRDAVKHMASDSRCFIASCVYGHEASQTYCFRSFRDNYLQHSGWGKLLVSIYYRVSPWCIPLLENNSGIKSATKYVLDKLLIKIKDKEEAKGKEGSS